ncbi:MAG: LysR family transcriptional regulator [Kofleriaceae bacterium]
MNLQAIDLNLLLVLHTVLEDGSVTGAARTLGLSQPAVSNALARLRVALDDRLVVRSGGRLLPTPRVAEMRPQLAAGLGALASLVERTAFDPASTTRTFTLADSEELSELPRLAGSFARALPQATLRLVTVDDPAAALVAGTVDVALGPRALARSGLVRKQLYEDHTVLVVRRGHPDARAPSRLARVAQIAVQSGGLRVPAPSGARIAMVMPDYMSAALAVSQCDHATVLPQRFARAISRLLPLRIIDTVATPVPISLFWHERTHADAGALRFRELVIDAVSPGPKRALPLS